MKDFSATRSKEFFDRIQVLRCDRLKKAKTKRLCHWRSGAIKHRIRAGDFDPRRTSIGKRSRACFNKLNVAARFGPFQSPSQLKIRKWVKCFSHARSRCLL